ncbi:glycosyl hydrolase [Streptacidiphilus pinicola]|uniref:Glycosyl hydrolase n=1 Tax=Streptacidiphilus pinicola TaxID=2219663 RepID=A0A2X0IRD2_9ACTN|nr:glycosyl hydrolase [Streptacidiphilus pinicola]RAG86133.1 glycosyl hydrolase [Streptacidiphilus pinicola]
MLQRSHLLAVALAAAVVLTGGTGGTAGAAPEPLPAKALPPTAERQLAALEHLVQPTVPKAGHADGGSGDPDDPVAAARQFAAARTAPAATVSGAAPEQGAAAGNRLRAIGGRWTEVTSGSTNSEDPAYADPSYSDYGSGWGLVTGRASALTTDGRWVYAGFADGGVWRSQDGGRHWQPEFQDQTTASVGALWVDPQDHSLWVGTGEANTSGDNYTGQGVYRSTDHGRTYQRVGGDELLNGQVATLTGNGRYVFAATSHGLWRRPLEAARNKPWQPVLQPDPNPTHDPTRTSIISSVVVRPGGDGDTVLAALGYRSGTPYDGLYLSTRGGAPGTFTLIQPAGIDSSDIGRTSLDYAPDGGALYALIQSPAYLAGKRPAPLQSTSFKGLYVSPTGDPSGPWKLLADAGTLARSGSAQTFPSGYEPGVGAWYNQYVKVDPADPRHVYVGLEEIYETRDGGSTWHTLAPFWNYTLPCYGTPAGCPPTVHTDQHAVAIAADGTLYVGSDGGVWSRPASDSAPGHWRDLNAGLRTLQYFYVGAGRDPQGGTAYWGGLQDNGGTLVRGGSHDVLQPFAGDGGDVVVDPADADRAAAEYVRGDITVTTTGGRSDGKSPAFRDISPSCDSSGTPIADCDPGMQFIAPYSADRADLNHWVVAGRYVWDTQKGFDTVCAKDAAGCDWKQAYDLGAKASATAVEADHGVDYVGWCGSCTPSDDSGDGFHSGIATDFGGAWHNVSAPNLPNRYVSALVSDPADPAHVYAVYGGYSSKWIPTAGTGHVFESRDGGTTWRDISGNLPDLPGDALVIANDRLVLATDHLVYTASLRSPTHWSRLGQGLPSSVATDVTLDPSGHAVVVATHGRGLWRLDLTGL